MSILQMKRMYTSSKIRNTSYRETEILYRDLRVVENKICRGSDVRETLGVTLALEGV